MALLHRHQLVRLSDAGWAQVLQRNWDAQARACLEHWVANRLPLVVARQAPGGATRDPVALGLPAPGRWGRRRLQLQAPSATLLESEEFPCLAQVQVLLDQPTLAAVSRLLSGLSECQARARVFGSHGWQWLSGLDHIRHGSDLDVWVAVRSPGHADAIARCFVSFDVPGLRLDGEFRFGNGADVAWREWVDWRAGRARTVMFKHLTGVSLARSIGDFEGSAFPAQGVSA